MSHEPCVHCGEIEQREILYGRGAVHKIRVVELGPPTPTTIRAFGKEFAVMQDDVWVFG